MEIKQLSHENTSYNEFLNQKYKEEGIKRRELAKRLKINRFRFWLMERGYIKPNKNDVKKISEYYNIDYSYYLEGIRSYPAEINDKKKMKITIWLLHLFSKKWCKIALVCITLSLLGTIIGIDLASNDKTKITYYDKTVVDVWEGIKEKGSNDVSLTNYSFPVITDVYKLDDKTDKAVITKSIYSNTLTITFDEIYWTDDYRYFFEFRNIEGSYYKFRVDVLNYNTNEINHCYALISENDYKIESSNNKIGNVEDILKNNDFNSDFSDLIREKLQIDTSFYFIADNMAEADAAFAKAFNITALIMVLSLILFIVFTFITLYALIYGVKKGEVLTFDHSDKLLGIEFKHNKVKKDIKFTPFIPETAVRILGILLVLLGAFRIVVLAMNVEEYSIDNKQMADFLLSIQMFGMFIMFFINFDIYMDDERLIRNIILYIMTFAIIYFFEVIITGFMTGSQSIFTSISPMLNLPNPFGSAACYFLMMLFLFFTPKWVKNKKVLIAYRSMTIIPMSFIIVSFIIANFDMFFGTSINNEWVELFFRGDRFTLSILAMSYLVFLFFLRLYFKRKYGEEEAFKIFSGNRYIMFKNLMASGLILFIWIIEMICRNNARLNAIGIGKNIYLILFIPVLLFYHPHKGARKTAVDVSIITVYALSLVIIYIAAAITGLISVFQGNA